MDFKIQPVSDFGVEIAKFGGTPWYLLFRRS